jgi:hypothetical protein
MLSPVLILFVVFFQQKFSYTRKWINKQFGERATHCIAVANAWGADGFPREEKIAKEWWRRGESNPRPKSATDRSLHAYLNSVCDPALAG